MNFTATYAADFYKTFHRTAYHVAIASAYENFTNRSGRLCNVPDNEEVCTVGIRAFIQNILIDQWNNTFFNLPKRQAVRKIKRLVDRCVMGADYDASHFEALHDLGYLPISIKALPEGSLVPYQVATMTLINTVDGFAWLVGYIETVMSQENWPVQTSATTSLAYLKRVRIMAAKTGLPEFLIPYMIHDFSARGMFGQAASAMSGYGHVAVGNCGTDTMQVADWIEDIYEGDFDKAEPYTLMCSVFATEHSTACSAILIEMKKLGISFTEAEIMYVKELFLKVPTSILSYVADGFDFWKFVTYILPALKDAIMAREGKFVVRPDSGCPVKILTGYMNAINFDEEDFMGEGYSLGEVAKYCRIKGHEAFKRHGQWYSSERPPQEEYATFQEKLLEAEVKGLMQCLIDLFGYTMTEQGYKLLPDQIGAIYGDAITLARQDEIYTRLEAREIVPSMVLGVGSYSFQYVTRDTNGSAIKATQVGLHDDTVVEVFKDPKTDSKKKSAKGLLRIERENGKFVQYDEQTAEQETQGWLTEVFRNSEYLGNATLDNTRSWVGAQLDEQDERNA